MRYLQYECEENARPRVKLHTLVCGEQTRYGKLLQFGKLPRWILPPVQRPEDREKYISKKT